MIAALITLPPLAHTGHVLVDLPIYLGPAFAIIVWLKISSWRDKRAGRTRTEPEKRERE